MEIPKKIKWIGLGLSPVVLLLFYGLKNMKAPNEAIQQVEPTAVTFDFIPTKPNAAVTDKAFLHISMADSSRKDIQLQNFLGKPTIVHFWATWCGACVNEMPELDAFAEKYGNDIHVVVIASDQTGGQAAQEFYTNKKLTNLQLYVDHKADLVRFFKIRGLPTTIFINAGNKEIGRIIGPVEWSGESGKIIQETLKS